MSRSGRPPDDPRQREIDADAPPAVFTLENRNGLVAQLTTIGATLMSMWVPDRSCVRADVVHGFDDPAAYRGEHPHLGSIVGRVANRIAHARFELDGEVFALEANEGRHHLHGGHRGWHCAEWRVERSETEAGAAVAFHHESPDGEGGYPGCVSARVCYTLTHEDALEIEIRATTDRPTLINVAHHPYWNLGGIGSGSILDHGLQLHASRYTPNDPERIPTGEIAPVSGTPFDFRSGKPLGRDLAAVGGDPAGYDVNFVVDGTPGRLRPVARLSDPRSGRVLELLSDQPGVQLYTGNALDGSTTGKGVAHGRHGGVCLETQQIPDAIHHDRWREGVILRPGRSYRHRIVYQFGVE